MRTKLSLLAFTLFVGVTLSILLTLVTTSTPAQARPVPPNDASLAVNPLNLGQVGHIGGQNGAILVQGDRA